jgi:phosphoglycolate phosphatase
MARRLVIFDCDGTLVDSQHAIVAAMERAFGGLGLAAPTRAATLAIVGLSLPEAIAALAPESSRSEQVRLAGLYRSAAAEIRQAGEGEPLFPGAGEAIAELAGREDIALGIATGKSRRGVDRLLALQGWAGHFETLQTADDNPSKPHPAMLLRALAETGVEPAAAVMVGDTTFDVAMARTAGIAAVGVAWGYHPVAALARAGAHETAATFEAVLAACERLTARGGNAR